MHRGEESLHIDQEQRQFGECFPFPFLLSPGEWQQTKGATLVSTNPMHTINGPGHLWGLWGGKDYCARTELLTEFPFSPQTLPNPLSISSSWYVCLWSIYSGPVAESQFTEELNLKMDTLFREKGNPDCTVMWHASRSCHKLTKKTGFHVFNFWMTHVQVPTVLITSQAHRLV